MDVCLQGVMLSTASLVWVCESCLCVCMSLVICCVHKATLSSIMRRPLVCLSHSTRVRSVCMSGAKTLNLKSNSTIADLCGMAYKHNHLPHAAREQCECIPAHSPSSSSCPQ